MYPNSVQAGFNVKALAVSNKTIRRKRLLRWSVICLLAVLTLSIFANYLGRLPRERHARQFPFWEKVKLGGNRVLSTAFLTLGATRSDPRQSPLPVAEIYIKGKRLDKLTANLPASGGELQKADFKIAGRSYSSRVRFRGDSINHWAFPQKSWRVNLSKGKTFDGVRSFNLNVPRVRTQISNWLGYTLATRMSGLLVPRAENYHFRLNRNFDGVRLFLEQPNQEFLQARNLEAGKIFVGDINSEQIYGGVKRKRLYQDVTAWEVRSPSVETDRQEMARLISILKTEHNPYARYYKLENIVDIDALLNYMALLELVGSVHVDETHNGKFYFDAVKGKFIPIVWDTVAYFWKGRGLDLGPNTLFRSVLGIPEWREQKDKLLWKAIHGPLSTDNIQALIKKEVARIRADIEAFALKIHASNRGIIHISNREWHAAIEDLLQTVAEQNEFIQAELSRVSAGMRIVKDDTTNRYQLAVQVASRAGIRLDKVRLKVAGLSTGAKVQATRRGLSDILRAIDPNKGSLSGVVRDGVLEFQPGDRLYSRRTFEKGRRVKLLPSNYVYEFDLPAGASISGVEGVESYNAITGGKIDLNVDEKLAINEYRSNTVWWSPRRFAKRDTVELSGKQVLEKDLLLNAYTNLLLKPGTELLLKPDVSIVLRGGELKAVGTSQSPISIRSFDANAPWGVVAVNGGPGATFKHVHMSGGSEDRSDFVRYTAPLSIHNTLATVAESRIVDGYISAKNAEVTLDHVEFSNVYPFYIKALNSSIDESEVKKVGYQPVLSPRVLGVAHGTPRRVEREFKFSVVVPENSGDISLDELAEDIQQALSESLKEPGRWKAVAHTHNDYWVDPAVKDFVFRDVYFDTDNSLNYENQISYRLRNRYKSLKAYKYHVKSPNWTLQWPYRIEFQAKTDRAEVGDGFSTVAESRFEFRKESKPFSAEKLPPATPWDLEEYIPYFQAGHFKGLNTLPAQEIWKYYNARGTYAELAFEPKLVLLTERFRQHLNIKSEWGSGPNPEQAYIISLDKSAVYDAVPYLQNVQNRKLGFKKAKVPPPLGHLTEIEVEFERNVSERLDTGIEQALSNSDREQAKALKTARRAFLKDQRTIMEVIKEYFSKKGIGVYPAQKSKYVQAVEIAREAGLR